MEGLVLVWVIVLTRGSIGADPSTFYDDPSSNDLISNDKPAASRSRATLSADSSRPQCAQATTLSFCLDDPDYPSLDIEREIKKDYGSFYKMYAEVANQTTASLVEGVGPDQESKYDFAFYYGNNGLTSKTNPPIRPDYYKDGGYLCPAFIDYTGLLRATNARGEWQFVVNVKPWMQTVRLEQCFYPQKSCSYTTKAIPTSCVQKYSYQRLIAYALFQVDATQNVNSRTRPDGGTDRVSSSGSRQGSFDGSSPDSALVEKRRLREQGLTLGDMTSDPEVDLTGYNFPQQPASRFPPSPQKSPTRNSPSFLLDEGPSMFEPAASRPDPAYFPPRSNMPNSDQPDRSFSSPSTQMFLSYSDAPRGHPGGGPGGPPPGFRGPPGQPDRHQPSDPEPSSGRPRIVLGPVVGPYGPPLPTYRPLDVPMTFYDYNSYRPSSPGNQS